MEEIHEQVSTLKFSGSDEDSSNNNDLSPIDSDAAINIVIIDDTTNGEMTSIELKDFPLTCTHSQASPPAALSSSRQNLRLPRRLFGSTVGDVHREKRSFGFY
ncbi:hypothetical protein IV203_012787 [Nitzschia inconspicua]|uniref:Uncharacterized protein n=1 Tax=Nitzschia inconspicua TaxID=303405 RepID=A0A9K3K8F1_9STRA|nr:hypothetical protein IV203_012763 [Nitzschia inconspicua]KAG7350046.1 hypothetical protein IV203_012643 [Nitzschia inconspicua]KAG7373692.1 hypothetical protein IV203_012787 [Nitzschia inconspicua]